jgi:hypothetical protein
LYAQHVVVGREHVKGTRVSVTRDRNLRVVNSGEVAGTRWLVLFWLKREGVRVDTWHWGTGVVDKWLDLVEVLTRLFLESVLTVEDQLERRQWTGSFFIELRRGVQEQLWGTRRGWGDEHVSSGIEREDVGTDNNISVIGEVPQVGTGVGTPHQFLNWVVVRQSNLLGGTRIGQGISTSVLDLFDQVFVTLLRESSALFGVKVDVVTPHLQGGKVVTESGRQVKVNSDFVVLQGNQWQGQSWVSVEEEDQWQKARFRVYTGTTERGSHLTVVQLLGFVHVQFSVQSPPLLVVLVDSLATNGQFNSRDRAFRDPRIFSLFEGFNRSQFNVHVRDQITVSGDRDGNATTGSGGTVNSLFDVFHRKVGVAFVNRLEESDFWVTSQVDVLGAIGDELHETSGHSVCFCTIGRDFFFG